MKPHFKEAPAAIRQKMNLARNDTLLGGPDGAADCAALGVWHAMAVAYRAGYDYRPEDVETPTLDELKRLEAAGDRVSLASFRLSRSIELDYERKCLVKAVSMRGWAAAPSVAEEAAAAKAKREADAREEKIAERTREILAAEDARRLAAARAKAVKELEAAP